MTIKTRSEFPALLKRLGLLGNAAFIGVAEAYMETAFLEAWPGHATWIDVWRILDTPGYSGHGEDTNEKQEARYQRVLAKAAKFGGRCEVLRATSEEAAKIVPDCSLDFCHLDASHDYPSIKHDSQLWLPKMKLHSIISGHDYLDGPVHGGSQTYGVKRAVDEMAAELGLKVNVIQEEWPSWYLWLR